MARESPAYGGSRLDPECCCKRPPSQNRRVAQLFRFLGHGEDSQ